MKIIALDLAEKTGFAVDGDGGRPRSGTYTLVATGARHRGRGFLHFNSWLFDFAKFVGAEMLFYEAPIIGGAPLTADVAFITIGMAAQVEMIAAGLKIRCDHAAVGTVRAHFVGAGYPKDPKDVVMARCRQLGWEYSDHNAADAMACWDYAKATFDAKNHAGGK